MSALDVLQQPQQQDDPGIWFTPHKIKPTIHSTMNATSKVVIMTETTNETPAVSHELTCTCADCKRFWWSLFITNDDRALFDFPTPLGPGPLGPDATTPVTDTGYPSHQRDPDMSEQA